MKGLCLETTAWEVAACFSPFPMRARGPAGLRGCEPICIDTTFANWPPRIVATGQERAATISGHGE